MEKKRQHSESIGKWRGAAAALCRLPWLCFLLFSAALHAAPAPVAAPMATPQLQYELAPVVSADTPAPPVLLQPDTPPTSEPPLIPAPSIATSAPIPERAAANCIQRDEAGRLIGWMDYQQCVFSGRTLASAIWFDDLFGDWYSNDASMLVRAITEMTTTESEGARLRFRLRASAALPNAQKRLRLVVTDDSTLDESVGGQDVLSQLNGGRDKISTALRWIPFDKAGFQSDFDIGVRGLGPPDIFMRARLRKSWNIMRDGAIRFSETLRYGSESHGRSASQLDYEYAVSQTALARLSTAYEYQQDNHDDGLHWAHGISMSHVLGGFRSLGYGFTVNGHTQPNWNDDNYGPWILYRSNLLRSWMFYEIEPRVTWYESRGGDALVSLTLRLEIQLGRKK